MDSDIGGPVYQPAMSPSRQGFDESAGHVMRTPPRQHQALRGSASAVNEMQRPTFASSQYDSTREAPIQTRSGYSSGSSSPQRMAAQPVPPPPQRAPPMEPQRAGRVPSPRRAPPRPSSATTTAQPSRGTSPGSTSTAMAIHVPLSDTKTLGEQRERAKASGDSLELLRWAMQVVKYVERMQMSQTQIDQQVTQWVDEAILQIVQSASDPDAPGEALYARGDLLASGAFPTYVSKDLRSAFSDFERSARKGYAPSWFRIGRDYETLGDIARARSAYSRGVKLSDVSSTYRMGMATLLGQLELPVSVQEGIKLLHAAADMSTVDTPHPAYIYALLLAGELTNVQVPLAALFDGQVQSKNMSHAMLFPKARHYLQRAAYLNLTLAQYKCGWCFEHAQLSFPFDPLLSVQYYSAASQGGEPDADMALSKWFLCGADGCFDKNETLAWTFAERAARHQLPTAEFALGYYLEVGIGTQINLEHAQQWYEKAAAQGNTDAAERLGALKSSQEAGLSRAQHQENLDSRLYSEHTLARSRSIHQPGFASAPANHGDLARTHTMRMVDASVRRQRVENARSSPRPAEPTGPAAGGPAQSGRAPATPPGAGPPKKGPATFSEMGIQPKHERDCTIC